MERENVFNAGILIIPRRVQVYLVVVNNLNSDHSQIVYESRMHDDTQQESSQGHER